MVETDMFSYAFPAQERHELVGVDPEECHKDDQSAAAPLLCKKG